MTKLPRRIKKEEPCSAELKPEGRKDCKVRTVYITKPYGSDEDAIEWKMKQIHPKLLNLWCPVKYELVSKEKVYVPNKLFVFEFSLKREGKIGSKLSREGEIGVIYDMNEDHAFYFDVKEELELEKISIDRMEGRLLKAACSEKSALESAEEIVKSNYLRRVLSSIPEVTLKNEVTFYREAWKLILSCRGEEYEKYAYRDIYGTMNEHVSGLKVRMDF